MTFQKRFEPGKVGMRQNTANVAPSFVFPPVNRDMKGAGSAQWFLDGSPVIHPQGIINRFAIPNTATHLQFMLFKAKTDMSIPIRLVVVDEPLWQAPVRVYLHWNKKYRGSWGVGEKMLLAAATAIGISPNTGKTMHLTARYYCGGQTWVVAEQMRSKHNGSF
jgi:hypothetical protein